jgi:hypothetical protein
MFFRRTRIGHRTPQCRQAHVERDRGYIAASDDPVGDEFGEAVTSQVLVDGDGEENRAGDRLK